MYRQVQCLYCPSGCRHRLRSRPCTHGPGAAASLQVSTRTRAPFSRAPGLGDTGGRVPSACPTAAPRPPWPAGSPPSRRGCARQGSQATSQLLLSIRGDPRGARHGPRRAGTVGTRGLSLNSGTGGGRRGGGWEESGVGDPGRFAAPLLRYLWVGGGPARAGTSTAGNGRGAAARLAPVGAGIGRRGWGRAGHPTRPRKRHEQTGRGRDGTRWDAMGRGGGSSARALSPPSCRPPARPPGPCPTEGSPPGPRSPRWGCRGLCSGEYRHFTLNIKRRIAFVTYRSQRGVSVDSKRGEKGARGRGRGWWGGSGPSRHC